MKARGRLVFLACTASALLALPAVASAQTAYEVHPGGTELRIPLGLKHHYFLSLSADDKQQVKLVAGELFTASSYSVEGKVSSHRIEADFGPLGRVDVKIHLHRGSNPPRAGKNCSGHPTILLRGTYRGTIEFAGERDVPAVGSERGRVTFIHRFRRVCRKPAPPAGHGQKKQRSTFELGVLTVNGHGEGRTTRFQAFDLALKQRPALSFGLFLAAVYERVEQVRIARSTFGFAGEGNLVMSKRSKSSETFKVKLDEPFSGKAVFARSRRSPSTWNGDLTVKLPGSGPIPFTGPDFQADLCRALSPARIETCFAASDSRSLIAFSGDIFPKFLTRPMKR